VNVIRFDIEVKKKVFSRRKYSAKEFLKRRLTERTSFGTYAAFLTDSQSTMSQLPDRIGAIYKKETLFGYSFIRGIRYYLFIGDNQINDDSLTVEVLVLSNNEQVTYSVNKVIDDIQNIYQWYDWDIAITPVLENFVYVYPFGDIDIYSPSLKLKGNFKRRTVTRPAMVRNIVVAIVFVCSAVIMNFVSKQYTEIFKEIVIGCILFLVTEGIIYLFEGSYKIAIDDLNTPLAGPLEPFAGVNPETLETPNV
jgi:hypothetical protein